MTEVTNYVPTDFIWDKQPTTQENLRKLLKASNKKNESLADDAKDFSIQFVKKIKVGDTKIDKTIVIEFLKDDWETLNKELCVGQEFSNNPEGCVTLWRELICERDGVSYYYCFDFDINGLTPLVKTQKELSKISEEIKKVEYYLQEAYKHFYELLENNNLEKELSQEEKEERYNIHFKTFGFREVGILTLARIYDEHERAVSLPNILKRIKSNFDKWQEIPDNKLENKSLDTSKIELDQKKLSKESNEVVNKLFNQRDKSIAHLDKAYVFRLFKSRREPERLGFPEKSELDELITIAKELCATYSTVINSPLNES